MLNTLLKMGAIVLIVFVLFYAGTCVYGNTIGKASGTVDIPKMETARYMYLIENTGTVIYANDGKVIGDVVGERQYPLASYWEQSKGKFVYRKNSITLDEKVFGKITMRRRNA